VPKEENGSCWCKCGRYLGSTTELERSIEELEKMKKEMTQ